MQQQVKPADAGSTLESHQGPLHIGAVTLRVRDLGRVARFYEDIIGLSPMEADAETALLGNDGVPLLRLERDASAEPAPRSAAGLFHTAFLLPTRADLGTWLSAAAANGWAIEGASDHLVSEAVYLSDPEGNGIEVYRDRPRAEWPRDGDRVRMANARLDIEGLLMLGRGRAPGKTCRMPQGARIGHVHLKVTDLAQARETISGRWGIAETCVYPGAAFFAAGGYHHHLATNIWSADGRPVAAGRWLGLNGLTLQITDQASYDTMAERWLADGGMRDGEGVSIEALGGIRFGLRPSAA